MLLKSMRFDITWPQLIILESTGTLVGSDPMGVFAGMCAWHAEDQKLPRITALIALGGHSLREDASVCTVSPFPVAAAAAVATVTVATMSTKCMLQAWPVRVPRRLSMHQQLKHDPLLSDCPMTGRVAKVLIYDNGSAVRWCDRIWTCIGVCCRDTAQSRKPSRCPRHHGPCFPVFSSTSDKMSARSKVCRTLGPQVSSSVRTIVRTMQIFSDNPKTFLRLRRNITHTTIKHMQTRCDIALVSPSPTHLPFEPFAFTFFVTLYLPRLTLMAGTASSSASKRLLPARLRQVCEADRFVRQDSYEAHSVWIPT